MTALRAVLLVSAIVAASCASEYQTPWSWFAPPPALAAVAL